MDLQAKDLSGELLLQLFNQFGGTINVPAGFMGGSGQVSTDQIKQEFLAEHGESLEATDRLLLLKPWLTTREVAEYFEDESDRPTRSAQSMCDRGELFFRKRGRYEICSLSCVMRMVGVADKRLED